MPDSIPKTSIPHPKPEFIVVTAACDMSAEALESGAVSELIRNPRFAAQPEPKPELPALKTRFDVDRSNDMHYRADHFQSVAHEREAQLLSALDSLAKISAERDELRGKFFALQNELHDANQARMTAEQRICQLEHVITERSAEVERAELELAQIRDAKMPELPKVRTIDVMRGFGTSREENYLPAEETLVIIKSQSEQIAALQLARRSRRLHLWHMFVHKMGWNRGVVVSRTAADGRIWIGFMCAKCGDVTGEHDATHVIYSHINQHVASKIKEK